MILSLGALNISAEVAAKRWSACLITNSTQLKTLQTFGRRKVELGDEVGVSGRVDRLLGAAGAVAGRRAGHVRLQLEGPLPLIVFEEFLELVDVTNRPGIEALAAIKLRPKNALNDLPR